MALGNSHQKNRTFSTNNRIDSSFYLCVDFIFEIRALTLVSLTQTNQFFHWTSKKQMENHVNIWRNSNENPHEKGVNISQSNTKEYQNLI